MYRMKKTSKQETLEKTQKFYPSFLSREMIIYGLLFLFVLTAGTSLYFYKETTKLKNNKQNTETNEVAQLIQEVSKIILLPEGEIPTVATVSDPAELQEQPFFAKAKTGDKVLLYQSSRKAYLYDPNAHKILEVSSITQ